MEEFVEGYVFATRVLRTATTDGSEFGLGGTDNWEAVRDIGAEGLPDELGAGAVLGFPDPLDFLYHLRRERDGHGLARSHCRNFGYYLVLRNITRLCLGLSREDFQIGYAIRIGAAGMR